uniref:Uncharacterized protein n=1 Tax=Glossina pallidipes TaxID=7398 RepID=A0A1A9ZCG2_GLOPL
MFPSCVGQPKQNFTIRTEDGTLRLEHIDEDTLVRGNSLGYLKENTMIYKVEATRDSVVRLKKSGESVGAAEDSIANSEHGLQLEPLRLEDNTIADQYNAGKIWHEDNDVH